MENIAEKTKSIRFRNQDHKENDFIYRLRKESWYKYNQSYLPSRVQNLWRYSNPESFLIESHAELIDFIPPRTDYSEQETNGFLKEYSAYGYNRADYMTFAALDPQLIEKGVIFKDLFTAALENEDILSRYLGQLVGSRFGKFEALNGALWNSGLFLYVPDNVVIDKPIRLQRHPSGPRTILRLLVVAGKNSELTLIDDYSGKCRNEESLLNAVTEIYLDDYARMNYHNVQRLADNCKSHITQRSLVNNNAAMNIVFAALGGKYSKSNLGAVLNGHNAESRLSGIVFGNSDQHFDTHTMHRHQVGDSSSDINLKVVLNNEAVSAYTGLIEIEQDAPNSEAFQENRNLLLSEKARAESIPELEIKCDEVRCSHGATMGPIDPEMLFYLKSRGFSEEIATRTIISGFLDTTLIDLPTEMHDIVQDLIDKKLKNG